MRKLLTLFAAFLFVGSMWATEDVAYSLEPYSTGTDQTSTGYANAATATVDDIRWKVTGNSNQVPWRIGGNSISNVDRPIYSLDVITDNISKIVVTHGAADNITVNSMTVIVSTNSDFSNPVSTLTPEFVASDNVIINRPEGKDWSNCYYKIVYNVTKSGSGNKFIVFSGATFYKEASTDPSITADPDDEIDFGDVEEDSGVSSNVSQTVTLTAANLTANVNLVAATSPSGAIFSVSPTVITSEDWDANGQKVVTVYAQTSTAGEFEGTLTISSAKATPEFTSLSLDLAINVVVPVAVDGVTLDKNALSLEIEETADLTATVSPAGATNKAVTWASDHENIATVDNGHVTAVAAGTATITVTTDDGGFTATCTVTVKAPAGDKLTPAGVSNPSSYATWPAEVSGAIAKYIGYSMGGTTKIQLKSNDNVAGIVSTSTGGLISKVKVTWDGSTTNGRTLDIYGYDIPYTAASELYAAGGSKGTKIGSIVYGTSTEFTYTGETKYAYVGVRSNNGALYLTDITFVWDPVSSIAIKTAPTKVSYYEDENFDPAGLVITATYESGKTLDIAYDDVEDFTFSPILTAALKATDKNISISYGGQSVNQAITVTAKGCTDSDLAYVETEVAKYDNDDNFTNPLTLTSGQTVTYAGDDDDVATVNSSTGEVTIVGVGTVHISASIGEEDKGGTLYCADVVSYTLTVTAAPVPTGTFKPFTGSISEGDYLLTYGGTAMNTTLDGSNRAQYDEIELTGENVVNPDAELVWHIAPYSEYWTIYSGAISKYLASTAKNSVAFASDASANTAKWDITSPDAGTYEFENIGRSTSESNPDNKWLRKNGTYGFGCYSTSQGGALTLYKKDNGSGTALDNTELDGKAVKVLRNGILLIEKNGHTYNAMGQLVK